MLVCIDQEGVYFDFDFDFRLLLFVNLTVNKNSSTAEKQLSTRHQCQTKKVNMAISDWVGWLQRSTSIGKEILRFSYRHFGLTTHPVFLGFLGGLLGHFLGDVIERLKHERELKDMEARNYKILDGRVIRSQMTALRQYQELVRRCVKTMREEK
jgi:hypothetical protein